ncbi:MAG: aldehyde dehydrogenase family protein, partial [Chitinophagaceae bacterium]
MDLSIPFYLENYIDGNFIGPLSGKFLDDINPATAEVFAQIPDSDERDVAIAVTAAERAFREWSPLPVEKKFIILNRIADLIDENFEALAEAETLDNGKPLWLSKRMDIPRASDNFRFFATAIMHYASTSHSMGSRAINYTLR